MGYPNPHESEYDLFMTGHAGCATSASLGLKLGDEIMGRPDFGNAVKNTIGITFISVGVELILGLIIALMLARAFRGRGFFRSMVLTPLGVPTRSTWFCPVSIGYERFVEEKAFVHELSGGEKSKENVRGLVRSIDVMVGRYGRLSVQFGKPLTLADVLRELDPGDLGADRPGERADTEPFSGHDGDPTASPVTRPAPSR